MFENGALWGIFRPKREEVAGGWRRLHNEELHNLYASPNIAREIKSRRTKWALYYVRRMEQMRKEFWSVSLK